MAFYRYIIVIALFLVGCAQVGTISGGEKDVHAPKPLYEKSIPEMGALNYRGKSVSITFDEFFRLDQPNLTIQMVPPHAKINTQIKGKTLHLTWDEDLNENTTYAIYLNNAVKDITERNDSVMQFVFSTGNHLDSLNYSVGVVDAWTLEPEEGSIIALFDSTGGLVSFCETNQRGIGELNYLKRGRYDLFAFNDENGDLEIQDHEKVGFSSNNPILIGTAVNDSIPLRMFKNRPEPAIRTTSYSSPGILLIGCNTRFQNEHLTLNGITVSEDNYMKLNDDSLKIFTDHLASGNLEIILKTDMFTDTASIRIQSEKEVTPVSIKPVVPSSIYGPWEDVGFLCNDQISAVDTTLIAITNLNDSSHIYNYTWNISGDLVEFTFTERDSLNQLNFSFEKGALTTRHGQTEAWNRNATLQSERKYGAIDLGLEAYEGLPIIIKAVTSRKEVRSIEFATAPKTYLLDQLSPGDYTFIVIRDENASGMWDVGSVKEGRQPELIERYSSPVKVRANWEVEVSLSPNKD